MWLENQRKFGALSTSRVNGQIDCLKEAVITFPVFPEVCQRIKCDFACLEKRSNTCKNECFDKKQKWVQHKVSFVHCFSSHWRQLGKFNPCNVQHLLLCKHFPITVCTGCLLCYLYIILPASITIPFPHENRFNLIWRCLCFTSVMVFYWKTWAESDSCAGFCHFF